MREQPTLRVLGISQKRGSCRMRRFKRRRVSIERLQASHFKLLAQFAATKRCIKLPSRTLRERTTPLQSISCAVRGVATDDQF